MATVSFLAGDTQFLVGDFWGQAVQLLEETWLSLW